MVETERDGPTQKLKGKRYSGEKNRDGTSYRRRTIQENMAKAQSTRNWQDRGRGKRKEREEVVAQSGTAATSHPALEDADAREEGC